jgi:phosphoribosylformimino-5-aminoimidazole carboxamide ribotide isomerase
MANDSPKTKQSEQFYSIIAMEIWAAIDILNGKCVRLRQGDYNQETVYADNPVVIARRWVHSGAKHLHIVDLDGAKKKEPMNQQVILEVMEGLTGLGAAVEVGGGIRSEKAIRDYLEMGVSRVVVGTLALKKPDWLRQISKVFPDKLVLGIDAKNGFVATEGWLETSQTAAAELAKTFVDFPLAALVYTDIAKDGMMEGPNFSEMELMRRTVPFPIVASGGITVLDDIRRLKELEIPACIIGKALYEKTINLEDALKI